MSPLAVTVVTAVPLPAFSSTLAVALLSTGLTSLTVTVKVSVAVPPLPSETVRVMVALPVWLAAGVMVTVRLAPLPLMTILPLGISVVLLELPVSVSELAAVSVSPMVTASAEVAPPSLMVWLLTSEMVGLVLVLSTLATTILSTSMNAPPLGAVMVNHVMPWNSDVLGKVIRSVSIDDGVPPATPV